MTALRYDAVKQPAATAPLRLWVYGVTLALLAFVQRPGAIVGDTKLDLVTDPGGFMRRALEMWNSTAAFGQIQNQAYGYFFPMGPFFWFGEFVRLDMWVVQRLWWTLLLNLAFFGVLALARRLEVGIPWTQVLAAFAYALSVHITTVIGPTSIEVWPSALAPWLVLCVVRGTSGGSERRWAAGAGVVLACCGGVNAAAVLAALPLAGCWLLTRRGRRAWVFLGWWTLSTVLATLWWLVPLFLMGKYSFPFLDYIENAVITTRTTGMGDVLAGTSDWVFFFNSVFPAGRELATSPYLLINALLLVAVGFYGIARPDNPHRGFLALGLVVGILLVSFGYTGAGHGWWADERQGLLDGVLAPLRNLHKFDNVLRLPLVLGLAHALATLHLSGQRSGPNQRVTAGLAVLAVVTTCSPWWIPSVAPAGAFEEIPGYWRETANYLNGRSDSETTLVVPAAASGSYLWGMPRDDVLQPMMRAPWATRDVIPFAQPGSVVLLNSITQQLSSGRPSPQLAGLLADNGIGRVVVRNDLSTDSGSWTELVALHATLDASPSISRVQTFGPEVGRLPANITPEGVREVLAGSIASVYPAVEIYDVRDPAPRAFTVNRDDVRHRFGGAPGDVLTTGGPVGPFLIGGAGSRALAQPVELSDTQPRREEDFSAVLDMWSETLTAAQPWRLDRRLHQRVMTDDQDDQWSHVEWRGIRGVDASSSQAWVDAVPPVDRSTGAGAALDGDATTSWRSSRADGPVGQWWQVDLEQGAAPRRVVLRLPVGSPVTDIRVTTADGSQDVETDGSGRAVEIDLGPGQAGFVRVTATAAKPGSEAMSFGLVDVGVDGVSAQRWVRLPAAPDGADVGWVDLHRDQGRDACIAQGGTWLCDPAVRKRGDDGTSLRRIFDVGQGARYELSLSASLIDPLTDVKLKSGLRVSTTESHSMSPVAGPLALADGDPGTTWISSPDVRQPRVTYRFPRPRTVRGIRVRLDGRVPAVEPTVVTVSAGGQRRTVELGPAGLARFKPLRGTEVSVTVRSRAPGERISASGRQPLPIGIGDLALFESAGGSSIVDASRESIVGECGSGPVVRVDGERIQTSFRATVPQAARGLVAVRPCGTAWITGSTHVESVPHGGIALDTVRLSREDLATRTTSLPVSVTAWTNTERRLAVQPSDVERILVVSENQNDGWAARMRGLTLEPVLVDGWRQGYLLPAGAVGEVTLTFTPQRTLVTGYLAGAVGVLLLIGLLLLPARGRRPSTQLRSLPRTFGLAGLGMAAGVLAGWPGLVGAAAVALVGHHRVARLWLSQVAGMAILVLGAFFAWHRTGETLSYQAWVQGLLVAVPLGSLAVMLWADRYALAPSAAAESD